MDFEKPMYMFINLYTVLCVLWLRDCWLKKVCETEREDRRVNTVTHLLQQKLHTNIWVP